jgi:hypothetical protein
MLGAIQLLFQRRIRRAQRLKTNLVQLVITGTGRAVETSNLVDYHAGRECHPQCRHSKQSQDRQRSISTSMSHPTHIEPSTASSNSMSKFPCELAISWPMSVE